MQLTHLQLKFNEEVDNIRAESEKTMVAEHKNNEAHQQIIQNDIKALSETYSNTLSDHLEQEKELRIKRCKIESQLQDCLETYDNDMGVRQAELEEIMAAYNDEEKLLASLLERFNEQEREYIILMEEKAYEEHLELERRIEDLRRRVAARIIQRHWRGMKQRRLERAKSKKARKGKGKKKGVEKP
ncbi:dynein regulatory complex protein 10 [Ischnura elegans]|uniref:dynein regulatory complex protein 10 n=1 Tax=Ischnura elegans TaxID=197161 RepID=UPI001ED88020|nr:dynein regulatory complex protein 10 [Ischnura elegans]